MTTDTMRRRLFGAALCAFAAAGATASAAQAAPAAGAAAATSAFETQLRPMPVDDETKTVIAGHGDVKATWDGRSLSIQGGFEGLPSNATAAFLMESPYIAVPGKKIADLTVAKSTSGQVSGSIRLSRAQLDALRGGKLYVQVNSEKAPPGYIWGPQGTVWGWLLPAHQLPADGVPEQGEWFIPTLDLAAR